MNYIHTKKIMFLIVDLVIVAIIAVCIFIGYKRGLAKCLISVLAFFIALAVSAILFKPASAIVSNSTKLDENIQTSIIELFEKEESENKKEKKDEKESTPIMKYISEKAEEATAEKKKEIVNNTAKDISIKIIDVLCFIGIFIIARVVLIFIKFLADLITRLPLIKECDKIGGVVYGLLQALVIVFTALALITFISTMVGNYSIVELIEKSYIGSILNDYNILLNVIF